MVPRPAVSVFALEMQILRSCPHLDQKLWGWAQLSVFSKPWVILRQADLLKRKKASKRAVCRRSSENPALLCSQSKERYPLVWGECALSRSCGA